MAMIAQIHNNHGAQLGINRSFQGASMNPFSISRSTQEDTVRISDQAQAMNRFAELSPARLDKIERIRARIASGQYESDSKIDVAIERLAGDLI